MNYTQDSRLKSLILVSSLMLSAHAHEYSTNIFKHELMPVTCSFLLFQVRI